MRSALRRQIESVARKEGRSLSAQIERLLEAGLEAPGRAPAALPPRTLSGLFAGGRVPTLEDFQEIRGAMSRALGRRTGR